MTIDPATCETLNITTAEEVKVYFNTSNPDIEIPPGVIKNNGESSSNRY